MQSSLCCHIPNLHLALRSYEKENSLTYVILDVCYLLLSGNPNNYVSFLFRNGKAVSIRTFTPYYHPCNELFIYHAYRLQIHECKCGVICECIRMCHGSYMCKECIRPFLEIVHRYGREINKKERLLYDKYWLFSQCELIKDVKFYIRSLLYKN